MARLVVGMVCFLLVSATCACAEPPDDPANLRQGAGRMYMMEQPLFTESDCVVKSASELVTVETADKGNAPVYVYLGATPTLHKSRGVGYGSGDDGRWRGDAQ